MFKKSVIPAIILFIFFGLPATANNNAKTIVLTFDDGPRPQVLKELLPLLEKYAVRANFFVMGAGIQNNQKLVRKMSDAGHGIENHSWGHENFKKLFREKGADAVKNSVLKTEIAILAATGKKPKFFRPPHWEINNEIEKIIKSLGYTIIKLDNPDINTLDYEDAVKKHPPEILTERVKKNIWAREKQRKFIHILVFHELQITIEALKTLIPYFQNQEYQFTHLDAVFPK